MANNQIPKDILPTLIVGLGGTGFQVVKRLKKIFARKYGDRKLPIRYLIIDTDLKSFIDDTLTNNEKCQLRFNEGVKSTLDWAYANPNFDWLPKNPPITPDFFTSTDQGAGLMRPVGRLYLCKNSKLVYDTLNAAKNDLVDLYKILTEVGSVHLENIDRNKVYIVGSLAGGTGCGTFLDVSVMLSKIFNRDNTNLIGMFTLESCYDDKLSSDLDAQNRSKANCYAALKELEFYMSSIKNVYDDRYKFKYSNLGEIKLEKKLLDICYLVENKNEAGGVLTNIEDIYDLCSLQLYHEIGTKLGSQLRADYANFICKDKDPVLKRDRHFSTFASSSMEIPTENIKSYCGYRLASDILNRLYKGDIEASDDSAEELVKKIDHEVGIGNYLADNKLLKIVNADESAIENSRRNLVNAESKVMETRDNWRASKSENRRRAVRVIKDYVNENSVNYGLEGISIILKEALNSLRERENSMDSPSNVGTATDLNNKISLELKSAKALKKSKINEKKRVFENCKSKINSFIREKENEINYYISKELVNLVSDIFSKELENIESLSRNINEYNSRVSLRLQRINNKANKIYGGNIINREMVSKDFYEEHYISSYGKDLGGIITAMMTKENLSKVFRNDKDSPKDTSILSLLNYDVKYLIRLSESQVEKDDRLENLSIIEILRRNAELENKSPESYIKDEIEVTAKLAKPFWSAIKNPEVSWTECYYIGAIKDDNITSGFTMKPHEEIDNWIRSQTGERSRQARYVETTNPNSIDVIHIIMGACAAYLPDVKHYKQFYLKLLSDQTYPLHLNEEYVGLDDLVVDMDELFKYYTLAQAYGAIIRVGGKYIDNLNREGDKFIYNSPYCLGAQEVRRSSREIPRNISEIDDGLILGDSQRMVMDQILEDRGLASKLKYFIMEVESEHSEAELRNHKLIYVESYREAISTKMGRVRLDGVDNEDGDFIAYEKLRYENSFNK